MSPKLSQSRRRATVSDEYDYKYDSLEDPYVYPGTQILRNKFGIKHQDLLFELESQITNSKFVKSKRSDDDIPTGNFDLKHLQAVHKYLFGELYDWAGEIRKQGFISKGQSVFCFAPMIESYARGIFSKMQRENFSEMEVKQCACRLAYYLSEVNALHPFREGNGRSTRLWLDAILKKELRQVVDWSKVDKDDYLLAMERSPIKDTEIKLLLKAALTDQINDREVYMKGVDASYRYEGYNTYKTGNI